MLSVKRQMHFIRQTSQQSTWNYSYTKKVINESGSVLPRQLSECRVFLSPHVYHILFGLVPERLILSPDFT